MKEWDKTIQREKSDTYDFWYGLNTALAHKKEIFLGERIDTYYRVTDGPWSTNVPNVFELPTIHALHPNETLKTVIPPLLKEISGSEDQTDFFLQKLKES